MQPQYVSTGASNMTGSEVVSEKKVEVGDAITQAEDKGPPVSATGATVQRLLRDNRDALVAWNEYVEQHGLPLVEFRQF
jgi:hypothetical protein